MGVPLPLKSPSTGQADDVFYCMHKGKDYAVRLGIFTEAGERCPLTHDRADQQDLRDQWCDLYTQILAHNENGSQPFPDCCGHNHHPEDCEQCENPGEEEDEEPDVNPIDPIEGCEHTNLHVRVVDEETGDPIEDVTVAVTGKGDRNTDDQGWAKWRPIAPGTYDISVRKDLHTPDPGELMKVAVPAGTTKEVELKLQPYDFHIHIDADRDGVVDDDWTMNTRWTPGPGNHGAVILFNNDNDDEDAAKERDFENDGVDGTHDLTDLAPLEIRRHPAGVPLPPNVKVILSSNKEDKMRVFDPVGAAGREIIGPTTTHSFKFFDNAALQASDKLELSMEATSYPDASFDGMVELKIEIQVDGRSVRTETADLRVAPWLIFNHANITEKAYIVETTDNVALRTGLNAALTGAGLAGKLQGIPEADVGFDRWMQDGMEPGFHQIPGQSSVPATLRTPANRGGGSSNDIETYTKRFLLARDYGMFESMPPTAGFNSLDSFGNLECSPPFGKYPFGRIIYGGTTVTSGRLTREMRPKTQQLLTAQVIQEPLKIHTNWLQVGHVDEFISFLPGAGGTHGWKVMIASPKLALDLALAQPDSVPLFRGFDITQAHPFDSAKMAGSDLTVRTVGALRSNGDLRDAQQGAQDIIDDVRTRELMPALGLVDTDFIHLPILFTRDPLPSPTPPPPPPPPLAPPPPPPDTASYIAYTPGSVNMLVISKGGSDLHLCVPKPYGPNDGTGCIFEADIDAKLSPHVSSIHYIDDVVSYHIGAGEIHCGTNSQRTPPTEKWWETPWI